MTRRVFGGLLLGQLAVLAVAGSSGCGGGKDSKSSNPDLKVPNVPAGDRGGGGKKNAAPPAK